jgi:hypothetical protein
MFTCQATLVEGPSDAVLLYSDPAANFGVVESCTIDNGIVLRLVVIGSSTAIQTGTTSPIIEQGGRTAATLSPSEAPTTTPSGGSSPPSLGPSQTSASSPAKTNSGARKTSLNIVMVLILVAVAFLAMQRKGRAAIIISMVGAVIGKGFE